jgi:rRNA maturation endonuclease Nob1
LNIEIVAGSTNRLFKSLGPIKARVGAVTIFSKTPSLEDVNFKLQEVAANMGANGVIDVTYERGISAFSWKTLTAYGEAVIFESEDTVCPICAETIKSAAVKCRFCGANRGV